MIEVLVVAVLFAILVNTAAFLLGYYASLGMVNDRLDKDMSSDDAPENRLPTRTSDALTAAEAKRLGDDEEDEDSER